MADISEIMSLLIQWGEGCFATNSRKRLTVVCGGCLLEFYFCRVMYRLDCAHFFCEKCLARLPQGEGSYRCFYDKVLTSSPQSYKLPTPEAILTSSLRDFIPLDRLTLDLTKNIGTPNLVKVPCKNLMNDGLCLFAKDCPYNHSSKSIEKVKRFQNFLETKHIWECFSCGLTICMRLISCPVCGGPQNDCKPGFLRCREKPPFLSLNHDSDINFTSATTDKTVDKEDPNENNPPKRGSISCTLQ